MNLKVQKIVVILVGYEVGDRVVVFRDTKSSLGNMFRVHPDGLAAVIVKKPRMSWEERHLVEVDHAKEGWRGRWYVHSDDMRPE